jgi:hypothetical protein
MEDKVEDKVEDKMRWRRVRDSYGRIVRDE